MIAERSADYKKTYRFSELEVGDVFERAMPDGSIYMVGCMFGSKKKVAILLSDNLGTNCHSDGSVYTDMENCDELYIKVNAKLILE